MLGLHSKITGAIAYRLHDDGGTAGRAQGRGQRLERLHISSVSRHQQHRAGIVLRNGMNGRDRHPNDRDHGNRHDQQQHEAAQPEYQASPLRRERVKHHTHPTCNCTTTPAWSDGQSLVTGSRSRELIPGDFSSAGDELRTGGVGLASTRSIRRSKSAALSFTSSPSAAVLPGPARPGCCNQRSVNPWSLVSTRYAAPDPIGSGECAAGLAGLELQSQAMTVDTLGLPAGPSSSSSACARASFALCDSRWVVMNRIVVDPTATSAQAYPRTKRNVVSPSVTWNCWL